MKFSIAAVLTAFVAVAPIVTASPVASVASVDPVAAGDPDTQPKLSLEQWWKVVPWTIFPNNSNWEAGYKAHFHPKVQASFNLQEYDYKGLHKLFSGFYKIISANYTYLRIEPIDYVVYPNKKDMGGMVYITGLESGLKKGQKKVRVERDAVFAVVSEVNGKR